MTFVETSNLAGAAFATRHGNTPWTAERVITVRKLWKEGWSASQISIELGGATRNAVIGKLNRLGLTADSRLPGTMITAPSRAPRNNYRPDGYRRKALPKGEPSLIYEPPALIAAIERSEAACTFAELSKGMCRYPYGEPQAPDFAYCGRSAKGTYCAGHHRLCYTTPPPRQDRASRR